MLETQPGLPAIDPAKAGLSQERLARLAPAMQRYVDEKQVPGVLSAIARKGRVCHAEAVGLADAARNEPVRFDTIYRIYSMAKPVTAVAVMQLYEEGRFFLDDPVAAYIPSFSDMKVHTKEGLVDASSPITIRQLLTHSGGLTYSMIPDVPAVSKLYSEAGVNEAMGRLAGWNLEEYVDRLAEFPLIAQPGSAWRYSEGFCVLARLVEVLSGQRYGRFLEERIFAPLGMVDTGYHVPEDKLHRLAALYEQRADLEGFAPTDVYGGDYSVPPPLQPGGSGLVSTAADYLRFAQMLLNGGELDGVRLLSPTTVRLIMSDQFGDDFGRQVPAAMLPRFRGLGFGFGGSVAVNSVVRDVPGSDGEYAWSGWANTSFWIDPVEQLIGMVFTQVIPQPVARLTLAGRMRQMTYQAIVESCR